MIFHTAAEWNYYEKFYSLYSSSIKKFYPNAKLSLHFLGENFPKNKDIFYTSYENISFEQIQQKYKTLNIKDTKGYYALARWKSIPDVGENVVVSDTDIIAIKTINQSRFNDLFKTHEVINITRTKKNGLEGGMAMICLRQDIILDVNNFSNTVLDNSKLHWASDVSVRTYLYNTYKVAEIPEMHVFNKKTNYDTYTTSRSFAIFKGKVEDKINSLSKGSDRI